MSCIFYAKLSIGVGWKTLRYLYYYTWDDSPELNHWSLKSEVQKIGKCDLLACQIAILSKYQAVGTHRRGIIPRVWALSFGWNHHKILNSFSTSFFFTSDFSGVFVFSLVWQEGPGPECTSQFAGVTLTNLFWDEAVPKMALHHDCRAGLVKKNELLGHLCPQRISFQHEPTPVLQSYRNLTLRDECFVLNGGALGFPALKGHSWALLVKVVYSWYILRFGFVLEPPGILGIFGSFWGYLVYFVPFGGFIGVSVVYFVPFGFMWYTWSTSFWLCFGTSTDCWYTSFLLGVLLVLCSFWSFVGGILGILRSFGGFICHTWYILCFGSVLKPPGILGILRSFWVYLVYLGLHLVYLVYTLRVILGRTSSQKEIVGIL